MKTKITRLFSISHLGVFSHTICVSNMPFLMSIEMKTSLIILKASDKSCKLFQKYLKNDLNKFDHIYNFAI